MVDFIAIAKIETNIEIIENVQVETVYDRNL